MENQFESVIRGVYPGHPLTISAFIVHYFSSLEEANEKDKNHNFPKALGSQSIPGAGGCVYQALEMLELLRSGKIKLDDYFEECKKAWNERTSYEYMNVQKSGNDEAEKFWPIFKKEIEEKSFLR